MTIKEAITHARDVAERNRKQYKNCPADRRDIEHQTCEMCAEQHEQLAEWLEELQQYLSVGTVEELQDARERQRPKKYKKIYPCKSVTYYQCPCCNGLLHINENFCGECGQAILWEEE